jgi:2-keto-4-pentenoate hydratase/2-oxohepta-3-ene-1,7-dioic acid hydratase in catechol pathway
MKIARFRHADSQPAYGVVRNDEILLIEGDIFGQWRETTGRVSLGDVKLLAPVVPVNTLCIGRNYKAHAEEGGAGVPKAPLLFLKATSCLAGPGDLIVIPEIAAKQIDFEAELAVVIGRAARHVSQAEALSYVLGYTCTNDVSSRDCQNSDGQWCRSKSFDTFGPLGPWIETDLDPSNVRVQGRLNGHVMQDANTQSMVFSVAYLISYLSAGMTLLPGTVLLTGTPAGCGFARKPPVWLARGDVYEVDIDGIGVLRNPVIAE